jgi:hypothetical protein
MERFSRYAPSPFHTLFKTTSECKSIIVGEPYASEVNEVPRIINQNNTIAQIVSDVTTNDVVKPLYHFGSDVLLRYAENSSVWQPVINYNQTVWGTKVNDKFIIDGNIGEEIENTVRVFLLDALSARKNLEEDWANYLFELDKLGVQDYIYYYNGE